MIANTTARTAVIGEIPDYPPVVLSVVHLQASLGHSPFQITIRQLALQTDVNSEYKPASQ